MPYRSRVQTWVCSAACTVVMACATTAHPCTNTPTPAPSKDVASLAVPAPQPILDEGELYSAWTVAPYMLRRPEDEPSRLFVILKREPDRSAYTGDGERWPFEAWGTEYVVREAARNVRPEAVTLVYPRATCIGHVRRLVLLERTPNEWDQGGTDMREALEVEGCAFSTDYHTAPIAIGGEHPMATRSTDDHRHSYEGAEARQQLRRRALTEVGPRARDTLRGLDVSSFGGLEVITPARPPPEVWSGEVHSNDADNGETAYVRNGDQVVGIYPFLSGDSLIQVGERRYLVMMLSMMNVAAYKVFEWADGTLTPVLNVCEDRPAFFLDSTCHRPFEVPEYPPPAEE